MNILGLIKSKVGRDVLSFNWSLAFAGANLALYYFFKAFTSFHTLAFIVVSVVAFLIIGEAPRWKSYLGLIAIIALGLYKWQFGIILAIIMFSVYVYMAIDYKRKFNEKDSIGVKEGLGIISSSGGMFIISAIRTTFFNVSYMLFPLLFIWLAFFGIAWILKLSVLTDGLGNFSEAVTMLGVIFGLLQYYFSRHEERVQQKLVAYFTNITFPAKEFSFEKFQTFTEKEHEAIHKECKTLAEIDFQELGKFASGRGLGETKALISLSLPAIDDNVKFGFLEFRTKHKDKLKAAYKAFFEDRRKDTEQKLEKHSKELNELAWFMMSNINMVDEANVAVLSIDPGKEEPETYYEFLINTQKDILSDVFGTILKKKNR